MKPRSLGSEEVKANKAVLHSAMINFFSPAESVRPRRAGRRVGSWRQIEAGRGGGEGLRRRGEEGLRSRGGRRQGEETSTSWEEARALAKTCYTHTVLLAGQCWVLCDHILVAPCRQQNYKK